MTRLQALVAGLLAVGTAAAVFAVATAFGAPENAARAEARAVVAEFFQTLNERRYDSTCALLSSGYYRDNSVHSPRECAIGLRIGFMWSQEINVRITGISVDGDRAVVDADVDGAPGRIVLVTEAGRFLLRSLDAE